MRALLTAVGAVGVCALAACSSAHPGEAPALTRTQTVTSTRSVGVPAPLAAGPTSTATRDCPLVSQADVMQIIGQRLDHTTVQSAGGKTVGCVFYPITTGLAGSEHLPTHGYPSARISLSRYPTADAAHQVLAIESRAGRSPSELSINGLVGETFQTRFYPPDGQADWACLFVKGPLLVTVLLADKTNAGAANVGYLAQALTPHL